MKTLILIAFIFVAGCDDPLGTKFKCQDGVIYLKDNGAWIQALAYDKNKCLPMEESK